MVFNPNFVARNYFLHLSHFIVQNCAMIAKKAKKYLRNCVELRRIACNGSAFPSKTP